ncbi:MAG: hypothetical protein WAU78_11410 [Roseiarcus sp.]
MLIVDIEGAEETIFDNIDLSGVNKIMMELHPKVIGRGGVKKVFDTLSAKDFIYDPWHSARTVVTFSWRHRA